MELWIKVQNNKKLKQGLVKVDDLFVDKYEEDEWIIKQCCDTLGIYKTEKRALEVLDEISNKIKNQYIVKANCLIKPSDMMRDKQFLEETYDVDFIMQPQGYEIEPINPNVVYYEMPKE